MTTTIAVQAEHQSPATAPKRAASPWPTAAAGITAAGDPACPPDVQALAAVDRPTVQLALAGNLNATPDALVTVLTVLEARRGRWGAVACQTMRALARHPQLPEAQLRRLNISYGSDIGAYVGSNPAAADDLLDAVIARHGIAGAARVAANPAIDVDRLIPLSRHPAPAVRLAATRNPRLPGDDVVRRLGDPSSHVRDAAFHRLPDQPWTVVRLALQANGERTRARVLATLTARQAEHLTTDEDHRLRAALARYTTHASTLTALAADPDPLVRRRATRRLLTLVATPPGQRSGSR